MDCAERQQSGLDRSRRSGYFVYQFVGIVYDTRFLAMRGIFARCHSDVLVDKNLAKHATAAVEW